MPEAELRKLKLNVDPILVWRAGAVVGLAGGLLRGAGADPLSTDPRWERYVEIAPDLFDDASVAESDYVVLPFPWEMAVTDDGLARAARELHDEAAAAGKEMLVFYQADDVDAHVDLPNALMFKTSMTGASRRANEYAQPAWCDDLLLRYRGEKVELREWHERPVVGFCGNAPPHGMTRARAMAERAQQRLGRSLMAARARAIATLEQARDVDTEFVFRDAALCDADGNVGIHNSSRAYHEEFVQNVVDTDYTLCTRGWGNFSFRLYETLCLGRIPILIDTDCVLPNTEHVDWSSLCVVVPEADLDTLVARVLAHHRALTPERFAERQQECRQVWARHLSPEGFARDLHGWLLERVRAA
jgi:hypothetical protein